MKANQQVQSTILLFFLLTFFNLAMVSLVHATLPSEDLTVSATFNPIDATCGQCNGAVDISVIGGQFPYSFNWSNGATTEDIADLCVGPYSVTITDNAGCSFTGNTFVANQDLIVVQLESQAEVDEFVQNYFFCSEIFGTLRIGTNSGGSDTDISDLSGLSGLQFVGGNLFIFNNPNLTSLIGLHNITEIGSSLHLNSNNGLTNLVAFDQITHLDGNLFIDNHSNLLLLDGLHNLSSVDGDVYISNNTALVDISALSELQSIGGDLDIRIALELGSLTGLEQLSSIGGDLILRDNLVLSNISALDHEITIGGNLTIENTALSNCAVQSVCSLLLTSANATFTNNNAGCNAVDEVEDACFGSGITIVLDATGISCSGGCDGSITATATGNNPPFDYSWSTGAMGPVLNNLCSGEYGLTITDAIGLTSETSFQIFDPFPMAVTPVVSSAACFGQCNGIVIFDISGGTPPYTFSQSSDLCPGDHVGTITDANECQVILEFSIPGTEAIGVTVDQITDSSPGLNDGSIEISIDGGTGPLSFSWQLNNEEISTEEDPSGLAEGFYTLFITDAENCMLNLGPLEVGMPTNTDDGRDTQVRIHPNPSSDLVYVSYDKTISEEVPYQIWALDGRIVKTGYLAVDSDSSISVGDVPEGFYFLSLDIGDKRYLQKLLVR